MSIFAIYDKIGKTYTNLTVDTSEATARRNFEFAVSQSTQLQFYCKGYELRKIAEIDLKTGVITPLKTSVFVCSGEEVLPHES